MRDMSCAGPFATRQTFLENKIPHLFFLNVERREGGFLPFRMTVPAKPPSEQREVHPAFHLPDQDKCLKRKGRMLLAGSAKRYLTQVLWKKRAEQAANH